MLWIPVAGLILLQGCSEKLLYPDKPPDVLLKEAIEYIRVENFVDARLALNKIIEDYPDSPEKVTASLLKAEVQYKDSEYEEALFLFKAFLELYPAHRLADRAQYFLAMSHYQMMDLETRDQTAAQNALEVFDKFLKEFPNSKYRNLALVRRRKCIESLARNQMEIGKFYFRISSFQSAIGRFKQLLSDYPDQPFLDEALFLLGESYFQEQNFDEARTQYHQLIEKFPRSIYVKEARTRLRSMP